MTPVLAVLWLVFLIMIPVALFAPSFSTRGWIKSNRKAGLLYVILMIAAFFAVGLSVPVSDPNTQLAAQKIQTSNPKDDEQKKIETPQNIAAAIETAEPIPTASPSATPKPTTTPKPTITPKPKATLKPKATAKPTASPKPSLKPTVSASPEASPTATPPSVVITPTVQSAAIIPNKTCADFTTHAEAQAYFESEGGSASYNADNLDGDSNGKVCETLK